LCRQDRDKPESLLKRDPAAPYWMLLEQVTASVELRLRLVSVAETMRT
jgi:hypothetical protein